MELALSLGDTPKPFSFHEKSQKILGMDLGFCMAVGDNNRFSEGQTRGSSSDPPPVQLDLLPFSPVHTTHTSSNSFPFPWLTDNWRRGSSETRRRPEQGTATSNSTNTIPPSLQIDLSMFKRSVGRGFEGIISSGNEAIAAGDHNQAVEREREGGGGASSRGSDEDENYSSGGNGRKKLRLTKEQSAFLEDSFKEHNTLNPKQKLALANQLNLRPRQVEVWFQNRRARTKLKQTEVDCEYLKRCCETLTEENRRLQKEVQELRALKTSQPFYMQRPATTLTMCPSCERVATATTTASSAAAAAKLFPAGV